MYKVEEEIELYEFKAGKILSILKNSNNKLLDELVKDTGLTKNEISKILGYLNKSQYIKTDGDNQISISEYGKMIESGEIRVGYAPL